MKEDKLRVSKNDYIKPDLYQNSDNYTMSQEEKAQTMWLQTKTQASKQTQLRKPVFLKIWILSIQKCTWMALSLTVGDISTAVQQLSVELLWSKSSWNPSDFWIYWVHK